MSEEQNTEPVDIDQEEQIEEEDDDDEIEMPQFVSPSNLQEDDEEIAYYAAKLGIDPDNDEWDDELRSLGYSKILEGITAGRTPKPKERQEKKVESTRTIEEEAARKDFTGILNRIAPSNSKRMIALLRDQFAAYPPAVSISMFTHCIIQRLKARDRLPKFLNESYAQASKAVEEALPSLIEQVKSLPQDNLNMKPFLKALGDSVTQIYSKEAVSSDRDEYIVQCNTAARQLRLNTDVRRSIFFAIANSVDVNSAIDRLQKLSLSKTQRIDIPLIIVECCRKENKYNPFYAALASALGNTDAYEPTLEEAGIDIEQIVTKQNKNKKKQGGHDPISGRSEFNKNLKRVIKNIMQLMEQYEVVNLRNVALFCEACIESHCLSLSIFKGVQMMKMKPKQMLFAKILFRELFIKDEVEDIRQIFKQLSKAPGFSKDIARFIKKQVNPFCLKDKGFTDARQIVLNNALSLLNVD